MAITNAQFRTDFPEFADTTTYPEPAVTFWLALAIKMLNPDRWVDVIDFGTELFVAHQLVLAARNMKSAGAIGAPVTAKSVDKVSVNFDTSAVTLEDAGHWNSTSYGIQFWQMKQMVGMGGVLIP